MFNAVDAFEKASIDELADGVMKDTGAQEWVCLSCGKRFSEGEVFPVEGKFLQARRAALLHVETEHGPQFRNLLKLMHQWKGVSDTQEQLLGAFFNGDDDARVAEKLGITRSTVRNHRFRMKERARRARVFIAMMKILETSQKPEAKLVDFPSGAVMVDERFALTQEEYENFIEKFFCEDGSLKRFPLKAKIRVALLRKIAETLVPGKRYTEKELNTKLSAIYDDFVLIRRNLIDYGFMNRLRDGSAYWVEL